MAHRDRAAVPHGLTQVATVNEMLIDRLLPDFDVTLIEHTVVETDVATTWAAREDLDLAQVHTPLLDAALFVRDVPAKMRARSGRADPAPPPPAELKLSGDGMGLDGWLILGEVDEREVAFGAVGRFWQSDIQWYDVTEMTPEQFAAFDEPGWGRIAANFSLRPYGEARTLVSYEARTATSDPDSARKFARYWRLVRPFVGHIMRAALAALAREAQERARRSVRA